MSAESVISSLRALDLERSTKRTHTVDVQQVENIEPELSPASQTRRSGSGNVKDTPAAYKIVEEPIRNPRRLKIVAVGAGIAGLALLYKTKQIEEIELEVYEKSHDVGGVWLQNRYPGCSCDIPAHIYCYSFEGNPNWSQ